MPVNRARASMLSREISHLDRGDVPLYAQLSRILRTQIASGEYKPGDVLPTEEALSRVFGVSRITVREALRSLAHEGLIVRQSGKGTFVSKRSTVQASLAACTIDDLLYGGEETRRVNLGRRVLRAGRGIAESLKISKGTRVVEFRRLIYLGETPLAHVTLTVPYALGRRVSDKQLGEKTLILLLCELCNLQLAAVEQWTTASLADKSVGQILGIVAGDPVLVIERIFYDPKGQPIEVAVNRYRTQGFRHHLRLERAIPLSTQRKSVLRPLENPLTVYV